MRGRQKPDRVTTERHRMWRCPVRCLHFASFADERGALKSPYCIIHFSKEHTHMHLSVCTKTGTQTHSALIFVAKCKLLSQKKKTLHTHYTLTHRQGGGWGSSQMVQKTTGGCGDQGTPFDSCSCGNELVKEAAVVLCMSLNWWLCVIVSAVDTIMFFRGSFHLISWLLLTLHRM